MPEASATGEIALSTVWLLGVSMGLTACTVTCLPFMGTWALGRASGRVEAFLHTAVFLGGRIATYTVLAALAGMLGQGLAKALAGPWGNGLLGVASGVAGLWLLAGPHRCAGVSPRSPQPIADLRRRHRRDSLPPLLLGTTLALTPCAPFASLLALAAHAGGAPRGAAYGLAFGVGAALTPILVMVPLAGRLGREMRAGRAWLGVWLHRAAAAVLILLGTRRLWSAFGV
jgi:thiol:disulfide interchange protein DsbD